MKFRGYKGFALPTILIVSVTLMSVLVVASASVSGIRANMTAQYYNQIAKNASEAGLAYAKACLNTSGGVVQWSDTKPLRPFTNCYGDTIIDSTNPNYYVSVNGNAKTTFNVGYPSVDSAGRYTVFKASGSVDLYRTSSEVVWRTYKQNSTFMPDYVATGGTNLLTDSEVAKAGSNEVLVYRDITSIFDKYGTVQYTISFDIKSANTSVASTAVARVAPNGTPDAKYTFTYSSKGNVVPVSTNYTRQAISGSVSSFASANPIYLIFDGTTGTGNILTVKNIKIELGTKVTAWTPATGEATILVVGGGGSGGGSVNSFGGAGGGGAGGLVYKTSLTLNTEAPYSVIVGAGGASVSGALRGNNGGNSSFANLIAYGGGGGGAGSGTLHTGLSGASGGGAGYNGYALSTPGSVNPSGQGNVGGQNGATAAASGGGGGGAGGVGGVGLINNAGQHEGGLGGAGKSIEIAGILKNYAAGGRGGGAYAITAPSANTGNGGNGVYGSTATLSGAGSSGVVVVAYLTGSMVATGGDITYSNGYTVHTFKTSGVFTVQSIAS